MHIINTFKINVRLLWKNFCSVNLSFPIENNPLPLYKFDYFCARVQSPDLFRNRLVRILTCAPIRDILKCRRGECANRPTNRHLISKWANIRVTFLCVAPVPNSSISSAATVIAIYLTHSLRATITSPIVASSLI